MSGMNKKHTPERTCVVCKEKLDKHILHRIVRTDAGLYLDPSGKMNGRGAYLCDKKSCWELAVKTNILNKPLRTTLTEQDRERLKQAIP